MAPGALKSSGSGSALKAAATATLRGGGESFKDVVTLKLPAGSTVATKLPPGSSGGAAATALNGDATRKPLATVWDEEKTNNGASHKLASLATQVENLSSAFEADAAGRERKQRFMDQLHEEEMAKLDEIQGEVNGGLTQLSAFIDQFTHKFKVEVGKTMDDLHGDLRTRMDALVPRLQSLQARGKAVHQGLDEEREARIRENKEILAPLKEQIEKLEAELQHERQVQQTRDAELKAQMVQAVQALEQALGKEEESRKQRHADTVEEWRREQERLLKRQGKVEKSLEECTDEVKKETESEKDARIKSQDPIVEALTRFLMDFQADVKEKAEMGH